MTSQNATETYQGELVDGLLDVVDRLLLSPSCTCPSGYFWREKVHSPECAWRISVQEQANQNALANFHQGVSR